jgi:carbon monoxide dehydrogenase subunit G
MLTIDVSSFVANADQDEYAVKYNWQNGTIAVTWQGKTKTVQARKADKEFIVWGMGARYPTGTKLWEATIHATHEGKILHVRAGVDSRAGRLAQSPRIVAFMSDAADIHHSKR